jgi:hypothetical protein
MGRNYHVTGDHEAVAKDAERAKKPTRIGRLVLRVLGGGRVEPRGREPNQGRRRST